MPISNHPIITKLEEDAVQRGRLSALYTAPSGTAQEFELLDEKGNPIRFILRKGRSRDSSQETLRSTSG